MTSGNMGSGLAVVCKQFGNPFLAVMSRGNSPERTKIIAALGANVLLTDQVDGTPGMVTGKDIDYASKIAREYAHKNKGFYVDQFNNPFCVIQDISTLICNVCKQRTLFLLKIKKIKRDNLMKYDFLFKNGHIVDPENNRDFFSDVAIKGYMGFNIGATKTGSNIEGLEEAVEMSEGKPLHIAPY